MKTLSFKTILFPVLKVIGIMFIIGMMGNTVQQMAYNDAMHLAVNAGMFKQNVSPTWAMYLYDFLYRTPNLFAWLVVSIVVYAIITLIIDIIRKGK